LLEGKVASQALMVARGTGRRHWTGIPTSPAAQN
jgi:hypothetical protein